MRITEMAMAGWDESYLSMHVIEIDSNYPLYLVFVLESSNLRHLHMDSANSRERLGEPGARDLLWPNSKEIVRVACETHEVFQLPFSQAKESLQIAEIEETIYGRRYTFLLSIYWLGLHPFAN